MCGRYTITVSPEELAQRFEANLPQVIPYEQRFNAAPTQYLPVITNTGKEDAEAPRQIRMLRWGLIPSWTRQLDNKFSLINARAETIQDKPMFRSAFERRRCLVLSDGFYEWKKTGTHKTPMRITLADAQPFAMAGLWDSWHSAEGDSIDSFTIITTAANALMQPIHDRMPVILSREGEHEWLDNAADKVAWHDLLTAYPADQMIAYAVSTRVNRATIDDPALIRPA